MGECQNYVVVVVVVVVVVSLSSYCDMFVCDACRNNSCGQLGCNSREEMVVPRTVEDLKPVKHIACGSNHSLIVDGE